MYRHYARLKHFIEQTHQQKFYRFQPVWLIHPHTNEALELDLYSPYLNKAYLLEGNEDAIRIAACQHHKIQTVLVPSDLNVLG